MKMSRGKDKIVEFSPEYIPSSFDCTSPALNRYLTEEAHESHKSRKSFVYMSLLDNHLIGYVSLSASKVFTELDGIETNYPAILIGRLAVDAQYQESGFGTSLLTWSIKKALEVSARVGCRLVFAEVAEGSRAEHFYRARHKFVRMKREPRESKEEPGTLLVTVYLDFKRGEKES